MFMFYVKHKVVSFRVFSGILFIMYYTIYTPYTSSFRDHLKPPAEPTCSVGMSYHNSFVIF